MTSKNTNKQRILVSGLTPETLQFLSKTLAFIPTIFKPTQMVPARYSEGPLCRYMPQC